MFSNSSTVNLTTSYQLSLSIETCSSYSSSCEQRTYFLRPIFKNAFTFQRTCRIWWSKFYLHFFFPFLLLFFLSVKLTVGSAGDLERHQILLGHKCKSRVSGAFVKILSGKSCTGWKGEACIQLTSLEDAHTKWKYFVAFRLLFLWYMRFYTTQKIEPFTFLGNRD